MKFTIESFKTNIYRPAEWMFQNETIQHLILDLNKQYDGTLSFEYGTETDGNIFYIEVYKNIDDDEQKKQHGTFLTVGFYCGDKVTFQEAFNVLYNQPHENDTHYIPYWTCVAIQKKITQTVFKVLTSMQEYPTA